jgi:hypothetical protein
MGYKLLPYILCHFKFQIMKNTIVGARSVGAGAGAASRYGSGSGSDQMMRLLAAPAPALAPQHWKQVGFKEKQRLVSVSDYQKIQT